MERGSTPWRADNFQRGWLPSRRISAVSEGAEIRAVGVTAQAFSTASGVQLHRLCPGGDQDSTHSLDVSYTALLPRLMRLKAGAFYVQLASESDPDKALGVLADHLPDRARVFVGVIDPIDPRVESPEQVRDRVLAAARYLPVDRLGTCDDCGFAPFADDTSTARATAFAKIRARIEGTQLAAAKLG